MGIHYSFIILTTNPGWNLFDWILDIFDLIAGVIVGVVDALTMAWTTLDDVETMINNMSSGITNNSIDGMPVLEAIGAYRYLVGNTVFLLTYTLILIGCLLTIYKLVMLIVKCVKSIISKNSSSGVISGIKSIKG